MADRIYSAAEVATILGIWPEGLDYCEQTGRFPRPDMYDGARGYVKNDVILLIAIITAARRRYASAQRMRETSGLRSGSTVANDEEAA